MNFDRNNLDAATSPYLRQHRDNPVHWQQWSSEVVEHARANDRILLVSVGYATCHWCHVMAGGAFSDTETADYLNRYFVPVKVDREERPDIDRYLMRFLVATTGSGGWPLNAFLAPRLDPGPHPFFAMTFASAEARYGVPPFIHILERIRGFYDEHRNEIQPYFSHDAEAAERNDPSPAEVGEHSPNTPLVAEGARSFSIPQPRPDFTELIDGYARAFDSEWGGFGSGAKFPPHSTLLFLIHIDAVAADRRVPRIVTATLDRMMQRGLHDHLQGGFFRYCVDRSWATPHFEKMLYDQAMMLWIYSLAGAAYDREDYRRVARGVARALQETFLGEDGLYRSGHDADTDHEEGATYLWSVEEIASVLSPGETELFRRWFDVDDDAQTDVADDRGAGSARRHHLILRSVPGNGHGDGDPAELEALKEKLLAARRRRRQPFTDLKYITSWNCLVGIGLVMAYRYLGEPEYLRRARRLLTLLLRRNARGNTVSHSSVGDGVQVDGYLEDYAAILLFLTTLHQETGEGLEQIQAFRKAVLSFRRPSGSDPAGGTAWMESRGGDFPPVAADIEDHPTPSSVSLAERALLECRIINRELYDPGSYYPALVADFSNLTSLVSNGQEYIVETPNPIDWATLPVNTVQFPGERLITCFRGVCTPGPPDGVRRRAPG